jgi:hypothetical protein
MSRKNVPSDRQSECVGKAPFETKASALRVVEGRRGNKRKVEVYRCSHCHKWHLAGNFF